MLARKQPNSESIKHLAPTSLSTSRNPTGWASAARLPVEHPLSHASTFETLYAAVLKFLFFLQTPIEMDGNDGLSAHLLRKKEYIKG
ncbi:hypothetical protein ACFX13_044170 [Malus domestica]